MCVGEHLSDHYICRTNYSDDCLSVLYKVRCKKHLAFLEAIAIMLYCPILRSPPPKKRQIDIIIYLFGEFGGNHRF